MNLPSAILAIRWLIWDTFRQSLATRIFWVMLGVTGLCILLCLSVSTAELPKRTPGVVNERTTPSELNKLSDFERKMSGVDAPQGEWSLAFGAVRIPWGTYRDKAVRLLHMFLVGAIADTVGILLALLWTAAFLPTFLEPAAVTVLLAKPVPRWSVLAGKYLGVLFFVAAQSTIFVVGTWLALGIRTDVWDARYLLSIPVLLCHFAIFFSFSTLLAVWTRSTIVSGFGSLLFWFVCWGLSYGRHAVVVASAQDPNMITSVGWALEAGYWILPKPADMGILLANALEANDTMVQLPTLSAIEKMGAFDPFLSLLSSLAFTVVMLAISGYEFVKTDY